MLFLSYEMAFRAISSAEKLSFLSEMKNGEYLFDAVRSRLKVHRSPPYIDSHFITASP